MLAALIGVSFCVSVADARDRTLKLHFTHTGERGEFTYKRNGKYDQAVLKKLNNILRDWRRNEATKMDPRLFDVIWEVYREVGAKDYVHIVSGYRSLKTNDMLRRRGRGVAKSSLHTRGQAMDFYIPGVPVSKIRKAGLRLQQGGVGYYPKSGSPFVHLDTGRVRHWPRMTRQQLAAVFPKGQTLHVPSDGKPLKGYEIAKAKYNKKNGTAVAYLDPKSRTISAKPPQTDKRKGTVAKWLKKTLAGRADEAEDNILARPQPVEVAKAAPDADVTESGTGAPIPRSLALADRKLALARRTQDPLAESNALLVARSGPARPEEAVPLVDRLQPALPPNYSRDQIKLTRLLAQAALRADEKQIETPNLALAAASMEQSEAPESIEAVFHVAAASDPVTDPLIPSTKPLPPNTNTPPINRQRVTTAIDAANAIGSTGNNERTLAVKTENTVALSYAAFTPDVPLEPKRRPNPAALLGPRSRPLLTQPEVDVTDAALEEAESIVDWENPVPQIALPASIEFARFMGQKTTRTDAFVALAMPQPWSFPALFEAPANVFEATRIQSLQHLRYDRFAKSSDPSDRAVKPRIHRVAQAPNPNRFQLNF